jgi:hypothetical protein
MPVPLAPPVTLTHDEQAQLESIVRAHSTPHALAFRCQVILRAAASAHPSHLQVANEWQCNRHPVGRWRQRSLAQGLPGLQDAPRPGRPRRFSPLRASGCDGNGHASTCPVPQCRHTLESRRLGRRPGAAPPLDDESGASLADARCGGPHTLHSAPFSGVLKQF